MKKYSWREVNLYDVFMILKLSGDIDVVFCVLLIFMLIIIGVLEKILGSLVLIFLIVILDC